MKRIHKICFGLSLALFIMLGSFLNVSSDANALDDISVTYNSSSVASQGSSQIFGSLLSSNSDFHSFSYLVVDLSPHRAISSNNANYNSSVLVRFRFNCASNYVASSFNTVIYSVSVPDNSSLNCRNGIVPYFDAYTDWASVLTSGETLTFTLTNNPISSSAIPSGSISISENGSYDVTQYAEAVVNVPPEVIQGDYHNDLLSINNSILIAAAVALVIYFFYAIYKMLLGGKR